MSKELVISAAQHETRVAILEDGQLCEIYIEREKEFALVGSIYKGRVTRVLPGMQSAFVEIGLDSDAFLYVSDFLENLEEYDHLASPVENKPQRIEQPAGGVFDESAAPPQVGPAAQTGPAPESGAPPSEPGNAAPPNAAQGRGNFPPRQNDFGRDRRPGSFDNRRGRGGQGRWGRRGGRGDRGRGGELPPSKYAPSRPFDQRPHHARPYEPPPPPGDYEPVILPGESLAKYKDRVPAPPVPPSESGTAVGMAPAETVTLPETHEEEREHGLPESLYAQPEPPAKRAESALSAEPVAESPAKISEESQADRTFAPAWTDYEETPAPESHEPAPLLEEPAEHAEAQEPVSPPDLSEDEVTSLAEQLAEAKHEEAQEEREAEAAEHAGAPEEAEMAEPPTGFAGDADIAATEMEEEIEAAEAAATDPFMPSSEDFTPPEPREIPEPGNAEQPSSARISEPPRARFQRPMRRGGRFQRGGRHERQRDHRQHAPRRPQLISEMLKAGQEIIVQIAKEPLGKKGARITSHVALPGRFLVYMPTVDHIGVSRRIGSAEERSRLRRLVSDAKGTYPGGFIVRTAAGGATDDEIRNDVEFLGHTWDTIRANSEQRRAPSLLHRDLNLVERILRDYVNQDYASIWIDNEEEYSKVVDFVSRFQPRLVNRVKLYTKDAPIFEEFGIQQELDKALRPKVWLKSGGYIVINHTEALVAIDVNTGKYVGKGSTRLEDTIVKTNLEAVKEIVRQIRLRDLGGIIVVDFIDMEERRNRDKVMVALDQALQSDRAPSKVLSFNEFGLIAITRKRTKQALERVLCQPCPYCSGSGMVKSVPTICYEIQAEARKMSGDLDAPSLTLRVNPEIAKALKTRESNLIEELERVTRKSVIIQTDPTLHWEQYDIY
jgi:ribonuclease G